MIIQGLRSVLFTALLFSFAAAAHFGYVEEDGNGRTCKQVQRFCKARYVERTEKVNADTLAPRAGETVVAREGTLRCSCEK